MRYIKLSFTELIVKLSSQINIIIVFNEKLKL